MKRSKLILFALTIFLLLIPARVLAQDYYFRLPQLIVHVFWNDDGTASIDYLYVFDNEPSGHSIEYVDVAMPNSYFDERSIRADVDGQPLTDISSSGYQGDGDGVAVGLGEYSIPAGRSGRVHVFIGTVKRVLYDDDEDPNYASAVFSPAYFIPSIVTGKTDMTLTYHLPPGVQPAEPRWHTAPAGWPAEPDAGHDEQGRIIYTWRNPKASASTRYSFGASFPKKYIPESAIVRPTLGDKIGEMIGAIAVCLVPTAVLGFFVLMIVMGVRADRRRKLQYLPPKIAIEGHGIKRGLTAIEAAILLEQPMDKILTMILFAVIKKNAAQVKQTDPLVIEELETAPPDLKFYESSFISAFEEPPGAARRKALQEMMVNLVKSISEKMKGFSHKETVVYYRDIMQKAWEQVEAAQTPEVKSEKFDEVMEWTMLDRDYDERTRRTFGGGPVFIPLWWPHYDPSYGRTVVRPAGLPSSTPSLSRPVSLPHLPGSDFAASMVRGVQNFSSNVVGNITEFTSGITRVTNPPPPPSSSSRSGSWSSGSSGRSCACACACAGCACACAG